VIVSRGVAAIPQALFACQGDLSLTPQQVWFASYILSVPWSPPFPYPSLLKMAARTGYSKMQLHEIKNSLVNQGYLRLVRRTKQDGGQDSNGYDFAGLFDTIRNMLQPHSAPLPASPHEPTGQSIEPVRRRQGRAAAQRRVHTYSPEEVKELTGEPNNVLTHQSVNKLTGVADIRLTAQEVKELTGETDNGLTRPVNGSSTSGRAAGLPGRRMRSEPYIEASTIEIGKDDSNHIPPKNKVKTTSIMEDRPQYSPYIAEVITDFSYELGDASHIMENASQAQRLWRSSGLSEADFVEMMYTAKRSTREGQGKHGASGLANKMAYYFACLRRLVQGDP
jgi:hypothetical protein